MVDENNQSSSRNPFEDVNVPHKGELSVGEVLNYLKRVQTEARLRKGGWSKKDVIKAMEEDNDFKRLSLRGPVQIVRGKSPILAVTYDLGQALEGMFNISITYHAVLGKMYASIQKSSNGKAETFEAELKYVGTLNPETPNHIIISQGLAEKLGIENQSDINITQVYQKPEDIDLDKL